MDIRGSLSAESLLKIILVLVLIWIALEILGEIINLLLPGPFQSVLGLVIVVLIILWLLDRI